MTQRLDQPTLPADTYTDAPPLLRNPLAGFFQLVFWLFSHPSAWSNTLNRIAPGLAPNVCLASLSRAHWQKPALRRLLLKMYLPVFILPPLLVGIIRAAQGQTAQLVLGGVLTALAFAVGAGLGAGAWVSLPAGLVLGFVSGLGTGLAAFHPEWYPLLLAVACGLTGAVQLNHASDAHQLNLSRMAFISLAGLLGAGLILGLTLLLASAFEFGQPLGPGWQPARRLLLLLGAWLLDAAVLYHIYHLRAGFSRRQAVRRAALLGLGMAALLVWLFELESGSLWNSLWLSLAGALFLAAIFGLAQAITGWLGSEVAASSAGALGAAFSFLPFMSLFAPTYAALPGLNWLMLTAFVLAFSVNLWRPVLFYPLAAAWNLILLSLDRQESRGPLRYFRYHSLFWSEMERLELAGLQEYLLLLAERQPEMMESVFQLAVKRGQTSAVRRAQIEWTARQMGACRGLAELAALHRRVPSGSLAGPASQIIHPFVEVSRLLDTAGPLLDNARLKEALGQLQAIQQDLIRSPRREAQRFAPIALHWQELLNQARLSGIEEAIPNPYVRGIPLNIHEEVFVGRQDVMRHIEQVILSPNGRAIYLYGQRRTGKTSLLLNLRRVMPGSMLVAFSDFQACASAPGFFELAYSMVAQFKRSLEHNYGLQLAPLDYQSFLASPADSVTGWMDTLEAQLEQSNRQVILCMDEIEAILPQFARLQGMGETFFTRVRYYLDHRPRFKIILAGSHTLDELSDWSNYLISLQTVKLDYLMPAEAAQLIERPVPGFGLRYEPPALEDMLRLTRGQPNLVQVMCDEMVHLKNSQPAPARWLASPADVETAAARALQTGSLFFVDYQRQVPDAAGDLLRRLARQGPGAALPADVWRAGLEADFEPLLEKMLRRDLVEETPAGYRFEVELVRRWFSLPAAD